MLFRSSDLSGDVLPGYSVTIINPGKGYTVAPSFIVENPNGTPLPNTLYLPITPMTTTLDNNDDGLPDSHMYYMAHIDKTTKSVYSDQLAYVEKYFADLGYNVQLQINPSTMQTLQWAISW